MQHLKKLAMSATKWLRHRARKIKARLKKHKARLANTTRSADAIPVVLISAVDLLGGSNRTRYAVREFIRFCAALRRIFAPHSPAPLGIAR